MFNICLSNNIKKGKFHVLTHALEEGAGKVYQNEEILKMYLLDC